jgi:DnaK suppressor protein
LIKPTAKKAATAKKPVRKSAAVAHKPKPKAAGKTAAKSGAKAPAKATARPAAPKPKVASAKPTRKAAAKPAAKPAPKKTPQKATLKPATTKPTAKPVAKPAADTAPKTPAAAVAATPTRVISRSAAKAGASAPVPPDPSTSASRFADRFAPAKQARPAPVPESMRHTYKSDPRLVNAWKSKSGRELTEPELLAMPEAEYMNEKQLDFFRARLTALKDDLLSNAGETTEHLREDTSIVPDPADRATIEEEHALELRTRDRERKLLKKISQSLARIEAGDYGFCDETGEPFGLGGLLARPTATLSLEAQQRREMKQKMCGD